MTPHTPGKLKPVFGEMSGYDCIYGAYSMEIDGRRLADVDLMNYQVPSGSGSDADRMKAELEAEAKANAERLAHCWNCHDELVAELKSALATIEGEYPKHQHAEYRVPEMRALIAKAEGK